jgi:acid phosphatase (class A)
MGAGWIGGLGAGWFDPTGAGWFDPGRGGGRPGFAMRSDQPLADLKPVPMYVGAAFPLNDRRWDPDLLALEILPEFLAVSGTGGKKAWETVEDGLLPFDLNNSQAVADEIKQLLILAVTERPEALGEIMEQDQSFQVELLHLLMINGLSHPQTYLLMKLAARVGEMMMVHLKRKFNRARPSQICPTLYPPVAVPGHSAYPAGHALIARLTALCLKESGLAPAAVHSSLDELVGRIARNRCIAGLHFETDNVAGMTAADKIFPILQQCVLYKSTLVEAKKEWV